MTDLNSFGTETDAARFLFDGLFGECELSQTKAGEEGPLVYDAPRTAEIPIGARIIRTVRAYDALLECDWGEPIVTPEKAIQQLRPDMHAGHDPAIMNAFGQAVEQMKTAGAGVASTGPLHAAGATGPANSRLADY